MDTIRYLLGFVIKLALALFFFAFVIWLVGFLYPQWSFSSLTSSGVFSRDWLPAPKNYGSIFAGRTTDGMNGKVYVHGESYNGYGNTNYQSQEGVDFIVYTDSGTKIIKAKDKNSAPYTGNMNAYSDRSSYLRNLSLYEGGTVYFNGSFIGEAKDSMFKNGKFLIYVADSSGRIITSVDAVATGAWSTPGWVRFQATIHNRLPGNMPCLLIFQSATQQSVRVAFPVRCN